MSAKKRTYNTQRIKRDFPYNIEEVAELFDVHKTSIRNWIKLGLPLIDNSRPFLIHGSDLKKFLNERQSKRKQPCKTNEFYCLKCRTPRQLWEGAVDIKIKTNTRLQLSGLCCDCDTSVFKAGSVLKLPEYAKTFNVQTIQGRHIIESIHPTLMCHFERTNKR